MTAGAGIVGVLLAAGIGHRFGGDKLMQPLPDGTPLAVAAAVSLRPACDQVIAVLRSGNHPLADALSALGCDVVFCAETASGMGHSLAAGVCATPEADGWIVALADMPCIAPQSHHAVATCLRSGGSIVATDYRGQRGHPVGFSRVWFPELSRLTGDQGGRPILEKHRRHLSLCPVDDPGVILDIDQPEDLLGIPG